MISPKECTVVTELVPTWRMLWARRLRWQRGALENSGAYGITPQTMRYWAQQRAFRNAGHSSPQFPENSRQQLAFAGAGVRFMGTPGLRNADHGGEPDFSPNQTGGNTQQ